MLPSVVLGHSLCGAEALEHVEDLPCLRRGVSAHQQSSFDRTGGNRDRNCWLYQDDHEDYVVFDDVGAGCVYRFWMTHGGGHADYSANYTTNQIKIYIDEDVVPRFECSIADFFSGTNAPFLSPLAGGKSVSSGGMYSYVPIPYRTRCRIALTDIPPASMRTMPWGPDTYWMYYNVTYHKYDSHEGVVSWTGAEDMDALTAVLSQTYMDPKNGTNDWCFSGTVSPAGNSSEQLLSYSGTGVVNSIAFDVEGLTSKQMTNLWVRIFWDDEQDPSVDAPLGSMFGAGHLPDAVVGSLLVGRDSGGTFYCYFPMPFWGNARIVLENRGGTVAGPVSYAVEIGQRSYTPDDTGYFHAHYTEQSYTNYVVEPDYAMLDENGRGHVVGMALFGTGGGRIYGNGLAYLEGDERIYIDGNLTPQLHGTGTEDYFNGGWYFNQGTFFLPYQGHPVRALPYGSGVDTNYMGAYRLHVGDVIPFNDSIHMGMEHGGRNEVGCTFSSVVYYYKSVDDESGLIECAQLDVGNPADEATHGYATGSASSVVTNNYAYTGDGHDVFLSDEGRLVSLGSSFHISIPASNDGLLIRRRMDAGLDRQSALVRVDGEPVGDWVFRDESYTNVDQRWRDDEFRVPYGFTAGKSNVVLSLEMLPSSTAWSEYLYTIYAVKPFIDTDDVDADGMADPWEVAYFGNVANALGSVDSDGDGFLNGEEFIGLTDPLNKESYFYMDFAEGDHSTFSFDTSAARIYRVMHATNLVENSWEVLESIHGDGRRVTFTVPDGLDQPAFYKVEVDLE